MDWRERNIAEFKETLKPFVAATGKAELDYAVDVMWGITGSEARIALSGLGSMRQIDALIALSPRGHEVLMSNYRQRDLTMNQIRELAKVMLVG